MTVNLDTLTATVHKTEGVVDSAIALIKGLRDQIAAIPVDSSAGAQAAIDSITAELDTKAAALAAALVANAAPSAPTPPAETPAAAVGPTAPAPMTTEPAPSMPAEPAPSTGDGSASGTSGS